eukprot:CAMPEP_0184712226 /NCGR_PEP_ID=MMETSP0314-20130426/2818_1 /TAXON_ID=38298 /ORGANISM="Rhodella maculata, Strain CCMP 736" /LENGTH=62 /DNA_ID=CAMNT_0027174619 /DNA_START=41 /DNA_END=229 /DNA_ORIENTATION=-
MSVSAMAVVEKLAKPVLVAVVLVAIFFVCQYFSPVAEAYTDASAYHSEEEAEVEPEGARKEK